MSEKIKFQVEYFNGRDLSQVLKDVIDFVSDVNIIVNDVIISSYMDSDEEDAWMISVYYTEDYL